MVRCAKLQTHPTSAKHINSQKMFSFRIFEGLDFIDEQFTVPDGLNLSEIDTLISDMIPGHGGAHLYWKGELRRRYVTREDDSVVILDDIGKHGVGR